MGTKRSHEDLELASTGSPTLTRFRTRLLETSKLPLEYYDSDDSKAGQSPARKRKKKKKRNNLVVISLLLILGLGITTTTCYIYGVGPWKASHVRAFYTSTKFMQMVCWTAEEQTISLAWISKTTDNTTNQTHNTEEVNSWWERSRGHSPDVGRCRMNSSCEEKDQNYTYTNQTAFVMIELLAINNREVEVRTLNLTQLESRTASCTWIQIEDGALHTYCNWSCIPITNDHKYGYWKSDATFNAPGRNTTCFGIFSSWDRWGDYNLRCPAADEKLRRRQRRKLFKAIKALNATSTDTGVLGGA